MSEKALELIREAKRTKEQILLLHGLGLKELPKEISELVHLERLYLEDNQLTDISPLSGLANLSRLHLNDNQLADISPLSKLTNLSELRACLKIFKLIINSLWFWRYIKEGVCRDK